MSTGLRSTLAKHWAACACLEGPRDRALYLYGRILRRTSWPLPGRRSAAPIRLRGHARPFHVRLSSSDWLVLEEIFQRGEYSFVEQQIKEARWIVDLGANVGFTLRYWTNLFPEARLIAVEPHPGNCVGCRQNIRDAGIRGQVTLIEAGVGAHHGRAALEDCGGEWAYQTRPGTAGGPCQLVEVFSLQEILDQHAPGRAIDLLKCDIEGAERELFAACERWIKRIKAIAVELHPPYGIAQLLGDLARAGAAFAVAAVSDKQTCPVVLLKRIGG